MSTDLYSEHTHLLTEAGVKLQKFNMDTITNRDVLLIVDCQNDFFPADSVEDGGRFGVADGDKIVPDVLKLIDMFAAKKCIIVASKDFHTLTHCSFTTNGGGFPPHCVQGTKGADFQKDIGAKLMEVKKAGANVKVAFKGFEDHHECFGMCPYTESTGKERFGEDFKVSEWCNCYYLQSATEDSNIDCQPNIMAVEKKQSVQSLIEECLKEDGRIFVCGLAFDFCVLDTSINAMENLKKPVMIIHEATRASHIPGVGAFGSGFLTDPKEIVRKLNEHHVNLIEMN